MDLVLFNAAMEHVCRISRIVSQPAGNAMLIGVGGSGKQSLARLGSFIAGLETRQLAVTGAFKVSDLKEAIQEMYKTAGVKGIPTTFLMTDSQIVNDEFLIYLSGMLATGWVGDLFLKEDIDAILGAIGGGIAALLALLLLCALVAIAQRVCAGYAPTAGARATELAASREVHISLHPSDLASDAGGESSEAQRALAAALRKALQASEAPAASS